MMNSIKTTNVHHFLCFPFSLLFLLFVPSLSLNLDGTLLLSFKYSIMNDPLSVLENWDYTDETPCSWTGVTCSEVQTSIIGRKLEMFRRVTNLVLPKSKLSGSIPEDLGLIQHLQTLDLSNNFLNGTLPNSLFNASELQVLHLSNNALSGGLYEFSKEGKNLRLLNLSANGLSGQIPESVTSLENLTVISLRGNYLSGEIPSGFHRVEILDLSSNLLNGSLPMEFGGEKLRFLNLSSNNISGLVPNKFAEKIPENCTIDLSFNNLTGEIPESMSLSNQKTESFVGNVELCGKPLKKLCSIPSTLSKPPHSSNSSSSSSSSSSPAIAVIPRTHDKNQPPNSSETTTSDLQNQQPGHGLKPGVIAGIAVGDLAGVGVLALVVLYVYQLRKKKKQTSTTTTEKEAYKSEELVSVIVKDPQKNSVSSSWSCLKIKNGEETSEATGSDTDDIIIKTKNQVENDESRNQRALTMLDEETNLDFETLFKASAYILGSSGASIVYKAVLEDGTSFAVRRIGERSALLRLKEFENQVRGIAKMKHPNLVKVRGFYFANDEKLLICDYISNGSLEVIGHRKVGPSPYHLPFDVRFKIARGVARGLTYLHDKKHVHGNIKPSNILLNQEMEPTISDFGLQSLIHGKPNRKSDGSSSRHFGSKLSTPSSHDNPVYDSNCHEGFIGCTSPYHAPESHGNLKPNPKWDVYSFGILLLELLTGKAYSDQELRQWSINTSSVVEDNKNQILRMVDVAIRDEVQDSKEDIILGFFKLGFSCASLNPQKRPSMKYATQILENFP